MRKSPQLKICSQSRLAFAQQKQSYEHGSFLAMRQQGNAPRGRDEDVHLSGTGLAAHPFQILLSIYVCLSMAARYFVRKSCAKISCAAELMSVFLCAVIPDAKKSVGE
jgi:hypothetical protein